MAEFVALQKTKAESENSWSVDVETHCNASNQYDMSAKNPNKKEETALRQPQEILAAMKALDDESSLIKFTIDN